MSKKKTYIKVMESLAVPVFVLILWFVQGAKGNLNELLVPTIPSIIERATDLIHSGELWEHVSVSIFRVLRGYVVGAALGITIGIAMGLNEHIYSFLNSVVAVLRPIPMVALIPLFILWLGIGDSFKIALIGLGSFWAVLLNTIHGIQSVDPKLLEVSRVLEKKQRVILWRVYFPSALPAIITGLRLAMGTAWACVVAAEMMAASKGIGYVIMFARQLTQPDKMFVGVVVIGLIGLVIDKLLLYAQKKILWWLQD